MWQPLLTAGGLAYGVHKVALHEKGAGNKGVLIGGATG